MTDWFVSASYFLLSSLLLLGAAVLPDTGERAQAAFIRPTQLGAAFIPRSHAVLPVRARVPGELIRAQSNRAHVFHPLPVSFEPNRGQAPAGVKFIAHGPNYTLWLTRAGATFVLHSRGRAGARLTARAMLEPVGGRIGRLTPSEPLRGRVNYFIGRDASRWLVGIPTYGAVIYRSVYPNIDLRFHFAAQRPEYDWLLHPGGDPARIRLHISGMSAPKIFASGMVSLDTRAGRVLQLPVHAYQYGRRFAHSVRARTVLDTHGDVGIRLGRYDRRTTLVIDPQIDYATYVGGSADELAGDVTGIDVNAAGNAYVSGDTRSFDFPVVNAWQSVHENDTQDAGKDAGFIAEVSADGRQLFYATYFGGNGTTSADTLRLDRQGDIFFAGTSDATDLPLINQWQAGIPGVDLLYIAELSPRGDQLLFSTYYGGHNLAFASDLEIAPAGEVFLVGQTFAADFPVVNAAQSTSGGSTDGYVIGFFPGDHTPRFSTYLGGQGKEWIPHAVVAPDGSLVVAGTTDSLNFPTLDPYQSQAPGGTCGTGQDAGPCTQAFVARFSAEGRLEYSTYFGGSNGDDSSGITLDDHGDIWFTGSTSSVDLPRRGALQSRLNGPSDIYVAELDRTGQTLLFSTYLGGSSDEYGASIKLNPSGDVILCGSTTSSDFPTLAATQTQYAGGGDVFVSEFNPAPAALLFSTYIGGPAYDDGASLALDSQGNPYIFFRTFYGSAPSSIPTVNAFQPASPGGMSDGFLIKLSGLPQVYAQPTTLPTNTATPLPTQSIPPTTTNTPIVPTKVPATLTSTSIPPTSTPAPTSTRVPPRDTPTPTVRPTVPPKPTVTPTTARLSIAINSLAVVNAAGRPQRQFKFGDGLYSLTNYTVTHASGRTLLSARQSYRYAWGINGKTIWRIGHHPFTSRPLVIYHSRGTLHLPYTIQFPSQLGPPVPGSSYHAVRITVMLTVSGGRQAAQMSRSVTVWVR